MLVVKSGLIFLQQDGRILISPDSAKAKCISSEKVEDLWREMRYIAANGVASDPSISDMLLDNKIVFEIPDDKVADYNLFARNIQHLANLRNNPFNVYSGIVNARVLIVGAGTVGSSLIKLMSKYGMKNIYVVEGDIVTAANITSQLLYEQEDVQQQKGHVAKKKVRDVKQCFDVYLTKNNIKSILDSVKPDYVFCCADDHSLILHNLLLDYIVDYKYKLFIAGYSYSNLFVDYVTESDVPIFKDLYSHAMLLDEEKVIYHNSGTLVEGYLSSAFIMNIFIHSVQGDNYNHFRFDTEIFVGEKQQLRLLSEEERFNEKYLDFVSFQRGLKHYAGRQSLELFGDTDYTCKVVGSRDFKRIEFDNLLASYNRDKGNFTEQYRSAVERKEDIESLRDSISKDFYTLFADKYVSLVNNRKNSVTKLLPEKLKKKYGCDFISDIIKELKGYKMSINITAKKMLEISLKMLDVESIPWEEAVLSILKLNNSDEFSKLTLRMLQKGLIDCELRIGKSAQNMTVYNPVQKISNIVMNYSGCLKDVMTLSHELTHAFVFERLKKRLNRNAYKQIDNNFWEILAKLGELLFIDKYKHENKFLMLSQYNLNFALLDYLIAKQENDIRSIDEIIKIKQEITEALGFNKESMFYMEYNFILFPFLYGMSLKNYDLIYQDAVAYSLFEYVKSSGKSFEQFYSILDDIQELNIAELLVVCQLDSNQIIAKYTSRVLHGMQTMFEN